MRAIPITAAEAIFEPLWDPGAVRLSERFETRILPPARGRVYQGWFCVNAAIEHAEPNVDAVEVERTCDVDVEEYDTFRVQCRMPTWASIAVDVRVDGAWLRTVEPTYGTDATEEVDGRVSGGVIEGYRLTFSLSENRPSVIQLWWLGLASSTAEANLASDTSPYDAGWDGRLKPSARQEAPSLGLLFGAEDLAALREKVRTGPLQGVMDRLRTDALEAMKIDPESQIGRFVPFPWHMSPKKNRVGQVAFHRQMRTLAFVGLVDGVDEYSRMAARMALSAAHCETWTDNIMGQMPGIPWHCRSFVEEVYCQGCALVLDWAGEWLTSFGAEVIRDAIAMKGLPRIESDFKRSEYIRSMNQGIVFSAGRVLGAMALLDRFPRYGVLLEEAERDLFEMIDAYVQPDGGTLEGPAYWNYTFSNALPTLWALSRFRKKSFADYVPESVRKTGRYALAMMSSEAEGLWYLPINDAHASQHYSTTIAASYCRISDDPRWRRLYTAILDSDPGADYALLIMDPGQVEATGDLLASRLEFLPDTGQLDFVRHSDTCGWIKFHLCGGPTYGGHFDEDKGAFVIEAAGEVLAMDRGVCNYDHPESLLIGNADRHNLLLPESEEEILRQPPGLEHAAPLTVWREGDALAASVDLPTAWPHGLFTRNLRRVFSPAPEVYLIEDDVRTEKAMAMSFLLHSGFPIIHDRRGTRVEATRSWLWFVPIGWEPSVRSEVLGTDSHLHPVNTLRMTTGVAAEHRLLTLLVVGQPGTAAPVSVDADTISAFGCSMRIETAGGVTRVRYVSPGSSGGVVFGPDAEVQSAAEP